MDIRIRLAKSEELEKLIELQSEALRVLSVTDYTEKEIEILVQTQARARKGCQEIVFVAEQQPTLRLRSVQATNNKIIGFSCLSANSRDINGIYIHPDRIRQKIGTKLLQALEEAAIAKNYRKLWVSSSLNAIKFYQANGYQKHFFQRLRLNKTPISVAIMSKQLIPPTEAEKITKRIILAIAILVIIFVIAIVWNF
ncbi:MAG: GNAT family N-acetyltransferase [Cyanobacteria bacterium SBLK]|nr:GNAT family N-acetyltransferase [Cyanobacteria bacterium SBLK]